MTIMQKERARLRACAGVQWVGNQQGFRTAWENMNAAARAGLVRGEAREALRGWVANVGRKRNGWGHRGFSRRTCLRWITLG